MSIHDRAIRDFRLRLGALLVLEKTFLLLTAWGFLWGTAILGLRAMHGTSWQPLLWGLAGIPVAAALGAFFGLRRLPSRTAIRALLDRHGGYGGMLMAGEDVDMSVWEPAMPNPAPLDVTWNGGRSVKLFLIAAGFVVLSFLVPRQIGNLGSEPPLEIGPEVLRLLGRLDVLKKASFLDPGRAEALKEKLEKVLHESSGKAPGKTLEALDHLAGVIGQVARKAAESAARKSEHLGRAETLADALRQTAESLSPKQREEAMRMVATLMKKPAIKNALEKHLDPAARKAFQKAPLSPEHLDKVVTALRASKKDLAGRLEKLQKTGLIDRDALKQFEKSGKSWADSLVESLKTSAGKRSFADLVSAARKPGGGAGPGDAGPASLMKGERTSEAGLKFKEVILPPAALAALKESMARGLGSRIKSNKGPVVETRPEPPVSGALAKAAPGSGSTNAAVVLPRHRGTVERYFERPSEPLPDGRGSDKRPSGAR